MPQRKKKARAHDPGGLVRIPVPAHVRSSAIFGGKSNEYRYTLTRTWAPGPRVTFVLMNPSTADPEVDDPTVAKCRRLAVKWGYGGMHVANTFAYRATDQNRLGEVDDPVGPENDHHILQMALDSALVIFAYGQPKHRRLQARGDEVARSLLHKGIQPHILRLSKNGTPWHPLYLPETLQPIPWLLSGSDKLPA